MQNDFGIARSLEDGTFALQLAPQFAGIGDIAVVRDRDLSLVAVDGERLRVQQHRIAGGGIARVADGQIAGQAGDALPA